MNEPTQIGTYVVSPMATPEGVRLTVMVTTDPPPVREFRPVMNFLLSPAAAYELMGRIALELENHRDAPRPGSIAVIEFPSRGDGNEVPG